MWADTKTEGFEKATASTTYNSTVTVSAGNSDCNIGWSIYYGTVSTNDKISGSKSAQMRWYSNAKDNIPYAKTTTAIDGLSNVALKARTSSLDVKMDVCYSEDGETWTVGKTHTFTEKGTGEDVSLAIPSGNSYVKFEVNSSSTAPTSGNYKLIVDDVVFTYTSDKEDATWSLDPASATIMEGENTTLQLTTNYDGTLTFTSEDPDIATVSYNATTKVVTVNGVAAGSTSITVAGDATSTYTAISKSIEVTVTHVELPYATSEIIANFGYAFWDEIAESGASADEINGTQGGVSVKVEKADGTAPRADDNYLRFYKKCTMTISVPTGCYITKVVFTEPSPGASWAGGIKTTVGDYVESEKTWYATTTDVNSIVFNGGTTNTNRIGGVKVYINGSISATITAAGYATFVAPVAVDFSATSLDVYTAQVNDAKNGVVLNEVASKKVPANTAVILKGETAAGAVIATADALENNDLVAGPVTGDGASHYALGKEGAKVGFGILADGKELPANKAYIPASKFGASAPAFMPFDFGGTTDISEKVIVKSEKFLSEESVARNATAPVYNLAGQRVMNPSKGLFIMNGKKVAIK